MERKKIAIYTSTYLPVIGGLQFLLQFIVKELDDRLGRGEDLGFDVVFIVEGKESEDHCNFDHVNVQYLFTAKEKKRSKLNILKRLYKIVKNERIDIVHTFSIIPDSFYIFVLKKLLRVPVDYISGSQGIDLSVVPEINYGLRLDWKYNLLSKIIVRYELGHQVPSEAMAYFCREIGIPDKKIFVIPNCIPNNLNYRVQDDLVAEVRSMYNITSDDLVCLSLSGLRPIKGLSYLVDAFAEIHKENKHIKLFLTCHGELTDQLKEKVASMGLADTIFFVGFITGEKKEAFFEVSDVFCIPSIFEAFGISLIEAMHRGKVPVLSEVGGLKDIVTDGVDGFFVQPKSTDDIVEKLLHVYDHKENLDVIIENAKASAEKYKVSNVIEEIISMYKRFV
jgi:glycosyltransferase involved in cell wall biosynthesis